MKYLLVLTLLLTSCTVQTRSKAQAYKSKIPVLRLDHVMGFISSHGTGVLVEHNDQLMILSAYHVFSDCTNKSQIRITTEDHELFHCRIDKVVMLPEHDLIVIYVSGLLSGIKPLMVGSADLMGRGTAMGYPGAGDLKAYGGHVTSERIRYSGTVKSGMSGGPLIVNGYVVGIASTRTMDETAGEFVPVEKVLELLK